MSKCLRSVILKATARVTDNWTDQENIGTRMKILFASAPIATTPFFSGHLMTDIRCRQNRIGWHGGFSLPLQQRHHHYTSEN